MPNPAPLPRAAFLLLTAIILIDPLSRPALAYVDPGSGALLWQGLLAALFGAAFYFRQIGRWVRGKLGRDHSRNDG